MTILGYRYVWRPSPDASLQLFAESWSIAAGEMYDLLDSTIKTDIERLTQNFSRFD